MGSTAGRSAFGGYITAAPFTLLDSIPLYGLDPDTFGTDVQGSGTVDDDLDNSATLLAVTSGATDYAKIRSHEDFRYQAGKGQRIIQSLWHTESVPANQVRRWGYFDDNDGVFFEARDDGNVYGVLRSSTSGSPVDTTYELGLPDIDITKGNIYELEFQWLGVGTVTFIVNGRAALSIPNANQNSAAYMKTAYLPVGAEVVNTGASAEGSLSIICNHVRSEGGQPSPQKVFSYARSAAISPGGTLRPVLSFRLASTFKTAENRMLAYPHRFLASVVGSGSQRMLIQIVLNPATLTGGSWSAVDTESSMEVNEGATAFTGGTLLANYVTASSEEVVHEELGHIFDTLRRRLTRQAFGAGSDVLVIAAQAISGTPDILPTLDWGEVH